MNSRKENKTQKHPAIFNIYPDLKKNLSWLPLGTFPTPVKQLKRLNHESLWIKRDDMTSPVYGGNKVRKLEFILGDVIKSKKSRVITIGGIGTNHGLATAIYCQSKGLRCSLLLFDQPVTEYVRQNLLLFHNYGAEMIYTGSIFEAGAGFYITRRIRNPSAYFLYAGGSSPIGTIGFVNAAFELKRQIEDGLMPMPDYIVCALGSNGTLAGLSLGMLLSGMKTSVVGVRVTLDRMGPLQLANRNTVTKLMKKTYQLLRRNSSSIPEIRINPPEIINDCFGTGYGHPTPECKDAIEIFKSENIKLEPTYTGKTCAGLLDFIKKPENTEKTILYWHTYNSVNMSEISASVDYHGLPSKFHKFFDEGITVS